MDKITSSKNVIELARSPKIIPREEHNILHTSISENALKVLYRLKNAGYQAYLVGGGVRDLLLGIQPKDFDVVTDARPEQIRELFRNCWLIGRRFRLAHVRFGADVIEVSTFRASHHTDDRDGHSVNGRITRDNVYGEIQDDVWRRDFTVNALFYNISNHTVTDYVGGLEDLEKKQIRLIGEPRARYREDPVRMLRAVRFAAKLGFKIHPQTETPIPDLKYLLSEIPSARLFEEFKKLFMCGYASTTYIQLRQYELFEYLFPDTNQILEEEKDCFTHHMLLQVFKNTDMRLSEDKPVTPAFLIAALLWSPMVRQTDDHKSNGLREVDAMSLASDTVISRQVNCIAMPRRFTRMAREIWSLQYRFKQQIERKALRLLSHPRFRAAYDFLLLRNEAGDNVDDLSNWWIDFVSKNEHLIPVHEKKSRKGGRRFRIKRHNN